MARTEHLMVHMEKRLKLKIALKELRETKVWLRMIGKADLIEPPSKLDPLIQEKDELISILVVSVKTATGNQKRVSNEDREAQ